MKNQMSKFTAFVALTVLGTVASQNAFAQSQPSAKVTAKTANLTLLPKTTGTGDWQTRSLCLSAAGRISGADPFARRVHPFRH